MTGRRQFRDNEGWFTAATPHLGPKARSFAMADWNGARAFYLVMTNAPGANAYPITASTFVLMHKQPRTAASNAMAKKFFDWALTKGQPQALSLDT